MALTLDSSLAVPYDFYCFSFLLALNGEMQNFQMKTEFEVIIAGKVNGNKCLTQSIERIYFHTIITFSK